MNTHNNKPNNTHTIMKPRKVRGFEDVYAQDISVLSTMLECLQAHYRLYGFEPLYTPSIEYSDVLGKFLPDDDRPNDGVFSFQDDAEQWVSLRYDLTAPLARYVAENYDNLPKPFKRQQTGTVWRNEKPGPGRLREFSQCDIDIIGSTSMASDTEIIIVAARALEKLGIPSQQYRIAVNNRKLMDSLLMRLFPLQKGAELTAQKTTILRAVDKLDRLGITGVTQLLGQGRKDESGDFTKGANLNTSQIDMVLDFLTTTNTIKDRKSALKALENIAHKNALGEEAWHEFFRIDNLLSALHIPDWQVQFDTSIVRGLDYYTGPVFEAELLPQKNDTDKIVGVSGAVGGGGRYDGLVSRFSKNIIPGVGFSIGVTRLFHALKQYMEYDFSVQTPVIILALEQDFMAEYFKLADELRQDGIIADVYMGESGMRAQMKYADKRQARFVIIEGEDERKQNVVTIKDLDKGRIVSQSISDNTQWRQNQEAQVKIPKNDVLAYLSKRIKK